MLVFHIAEFKRTWYARRKRGVGKEMAASEAQKRASDKWLKEKVEGITFRVPKGQKVIIQEHAAKQGESVNSFLNRAVAEAIERDKEK